MESKNPDRPRILPAVIAYKIASTSRQRDFEDAMAKVFGYIFTRSNDGHKDVEIDMDGNGYYPLKIIEEVYSGVYKCLCEFGYNIHRNGSNMKISWEHIGDEPNTISVEGYIEKCCKTDKE